MNNTIYGATTVTPVPMNTSGNGNYVEKFDGSNKPNEEAYTVYGQNVGHEVNIHYSATPKSGALAQYNDRGSLTVEAPQNEFDVANKKYVDDAIGDIATLLGGI